MAFTEMGRKGALADRIQTDPQTEASLLVKECTKRMQMQAGNGAKRPKLAWLQIGVKTGWNSLLLHVERNETNVTRAPFD